MSGYSNKHEQLGPVRREASLDVGTNNKQASPWGNGLFAEAVTHNKTVGPNYDPSLGDSFAGISQDLGRGLSYGDRAGRNFSDWNAAGVGGAYGGEISGMGPYSWQGGFGLGAGGGYGAFDAKSSSKASGWERVTSGYSGGAALGGRFDSKTSLHTDSGYYENKSFGGDVYRGVGGSVYGFEETNSKTGASKSGYGADANYTAFGGNDLYAGYDNNYGSAKVSAGNVSIGQTGGHLEGYKTGDGGYGLQGGFTQGRHSAEDLKASVDTPFGSTDASLGHISKGRFYKGGVEVGPDGSVSANVQRGGGLTIKDAKVKHEGLLGTTEASLGKYGGISPTKAAGGWDNTENKLWANAQYGKGKAYEDVAISHKAGDAYAGVGAERIEHGWRADGSGYVDFDDGKAHLDGNYSGGGFSAKNVSAKYGYEGIAEYEASAKNISTATTVDGASLDADWKNGRIDAKVDQVRTGGFRVEGVEGKSSVLGAETEYSVGEISNDHKVSGGYATLNGEDGLKVGAAEYDGGGIRISDAKAKADLGVLGQAEGGFSYGDGNNVKDFYAQVGPDGVDAHVGEFAILGKDAKANFDYKGPGGAYASAGATYHSGVGGKNVHASINGDGVSVSAENLNYNQHQLKDVHVKGGIDGIYDSSFKLGEGHLNQANINDLQANFDGTSASLSVGKSNYSYAGIEGLESKQSYFDGALGTELGVGKANYLGAGVDSAQFQRDFLKGTSSANIDGLNVHGLTAEDVNIGANVGDLKAGIGADSLAVIDANVGNIKHESSNHGLTQKGSVTDADIGLVRAENLGGSIGWGDQNLVSAHTDIDLSTGVDHAEGAFDLTKGTASGSVENARLTAMTDATLGFGDYNVNLGQTGVEANFSGNGEVDVMSGRAEGSASLAGSKVALFGNELELGDWAQASGGVDLSKGEASANLGGENGVGFDASLSEGNLDVNLFGHEIDIDQGIRNAGSAIADGASAVGSAVSDGASRAWDAVTSW